MSSNPFSPVSASQFQSGFQIVDEYRGLRTRLQNVACNEPVDVYISAPDLSSKISGGHARARTPMSTSGEGRIDVDQVVPPELFHGISGVDVGQFPSGTWLVRAGFHQIRFTELNGFLRKEVFEHSLIKHDGPPRTTWVVEMSNPVNMQQYPR